MSVLTPTPSTQAVRELDRRSNGGLDVRLLWCEGNGDLWVSTTDSRNGQVFCLLVAPDERPRDVFEHPFAYASRHHVLIEPGGVAPD